MKTVLAAVHYSRAGSLLSSYSRSQGVIFMLHHVRPEPPKDFDPNQVLTVTPRFLEDVIVGVREAGFDIIGLDDVRKRLEQVGNARRFACFTLDDGYRDNLDFAYPIFKRHSVPFTLYVPTDFADGRPELWWLTLEAVLRAASHISLGMGRDFRLSTIAQKEAAFHEIHWWLRSIPEAIARVTVAEFAAANHIDPRAQHARLCLSWDELRVLAKDPLVTIGGHTRSHYALAKLKEDEARAEMAENVARIEKELGRPCRHFSYPYGDRNSAGEREFRIANELGMQTAVTTQKSLLYAHHARAPTALPRLSLNGDFQDMRYVMAMLSGVPSALMLTLKRLAQVHAAT